MDEDAEQSSLRPLTPGEASELRSWIFAIALQPPRNSEWWISSMEWSRLWGWTVIAGSIQSESNEPDPR